MFEGCTALTSAPNLGGLSNLVNGESMFEGCTILTSAPNLSGLSSLENGESMFEGCTGLQLINMPSFAGATNLKNLFKDCASLKTTTVPTDVRQLPTSCDFTGMFSGCTSLIGGGGFKYDSNFIDGKYACVDYGGIYPGYLSCTDNSIYEALNISIDNTWCNNVNKSNIKKNKVQNR